VSLTVQAGGRDYEFDGPHEATAKTSAKSGAYVVTTKNPDGRHKVLDAGESEDVRTRLSNHDRVDCWENHKLTGLYFSAYYCNETDRMALEKAVRSAYSPACGDR
jgi:hypothetical protein